MEYMTTKEASAKWGISTSRITILANEGRIPGAQRFGRSWLIPFSAPKPPELKPDRSGSVRKQNNFFPCHYIPFAQTGTAQKKYSSLNSSALSCWQKKLFWNVDLPMPIRYSNQSCVLLRTRSQKSAVCGMQGFAV